MAGRHAGTGLPAEGSPKPVVVVTGTSGAGKGTIERSLLARMPELELAVSATTRERRPADEEFDRRVREGAFLEHVTHAWGAKAGTLLSEIDRIQSEGKIPLLDLETEGALRVQDEVPGAVTIFVKAPSFAELERRLRERATESAGEIGVRLAVARRQLALEGRFDHVIVNDDLERAVDEVEEIVRRALDGAGTMARP